MGEDPQTIEKNGPHCDAQKKLCLLFPPAPHTHRLVLFAALTRTLFAGLCPCFRARGALPATCLRGIFVFWSLSGLVSECFITRV